MFWIVKCEMFWIERRKCFYYMCSVSCFGSNVKCFGLYVKFEMFLSFLKNYDYISNSTFNFISAAANLEFEANFAASLVCSVRTKVQPCIPMSNIIIIIVIIVIVIITIFIRIFIFHHFG